MSHLNKISFLFRSLVFTPVVFISTLGFSQNSTKTIDSLLNVLKLEKEDTTKINTLIKLSGKLSLNGKYAKAIHYANNALTICDKILSNNPNNNEVLGIKARIFREFGYIYEDQSNIIRALEYHYESLAVDSTIKNSEGMLISMDNIVDLYIQTSNNSKALEIISKKVLLEKSLNNTIALGYSYEDMGNAYADMGNSMDAIQYYNKSLKIREQLFDSIGMADVLSDIALVYVNQGKLLEAMDFNNKSLKIYIALNDTVGISMRYNSIGCRHAEQHNFAKAVQYFNISFSIAKKINYIEGMGLALHNVGETLKMQRKNTTALSYYERSLAIYMKSDQNKDHIIRATNGIGDVYLDMGYCDKALINYFKSLHLSQEINNNKEKAASLNGVGTVYFKLKKFKEAEKYCKKSYEISATYGYAKRLSEASNQLSMIYEALGNYKDAFKMHVVYKKMTDSLHDSKSSIALANYESEKEALQLKQKQTERETQINIANQKKLEQKNYWIYGSLALLIIVVISSAAIYKISTQRQIGKNIVLEQKLLRTQMNPHFIFNTLASIQNFIYKDKKDEAHSYVGKFAKLMRSILENSREEFVSMEKEMKTLEHYLSLNQLLLDNTFNFKIDIDENIDIEHTQIPPMLAQPFIENALKHGIQNKEEQGFITISFKQLDKKNIQFEVEDNGIGFTKIINADNSDHKSFATIITQERLENLYNNKNIIISITEVHNKMNELIGTKTFFTIPFRYS